MTRRGVVALAGLSLAAMVLLDLMAAPPNPYTAPAWLALGSGAAPTGGFCGAPAVAGA